MNEFFLPCDDISINGFAESFDFAEEFPRRGSKALFGVVEADQALIAAEEDDGVGDILVDSIARNCESKMFLLRVDSSVFMIPRLGREFLSLIVYSVI